MVCKYAIPNEHEAHFAKGFKTANSAIADNLGAFTRFLRLNLAKYVARIFICLKKAIPATEHFLHDSIRDIARLIPPLLELSCASRFKRKIN